MTVLLDVVVPALCFGAIAHALAIALLADQHLRHPDCPFTWRAANALVYGGASAGAWLARLAEREVRSGIPGTGARVKPSAVALAADEPRPAQVKAA